MHRPLAPIKCAVDRLRRVDGHALQTGVRGASNCLYCHKYAHDEENCWERQRDNLLCDFCHRKGYGERDCYTKNPAEEERYVAPRRYDVNIFREEGATCEQEEGEVIAQ